MVDSKGKAAETPSSKPHKKRKKTKASVEEVTKKAKLLASTTFAVRTTKVYFDLYLLVYVHMLRFKS